MRRTSTSHLTPDLGTLRAVVPALALALGLALPAAAQELGSLGSAEAGLGDVVRVFGTDLGNKPKLALVKGGAPVKKTSLKVVDDGDGYVDVEIKKAFAGTFGVGLVKGKAVLDTADDTLTVQAPAVLDVTPDSGEAKDEITVLATWLGADPKKTKALLGGKKAKVTDITPAVAESTGVLHELTIQLPKVPNGVWPLVLENKAGSGTQKRSIEVMGSKKKYGKPSVKVDVAGGKPFKANGKKMDLDLSGSVSIGALAGSKKKPRVFTVDLPGSLGTLMPGDSFVDGPAQITLTDTDKEGPTSWFADPAAPGDSFSIDVVTVDDERIVVSVCGTLRRVFGSAEPETLDISGLVISGTEETDDVGNPSSPCGDGMTASMSVTGDWTANDGASAVSLPFVNSTTITGFSVDGLGASTMAMSVGPFDPASQNSGTFSGIDLLGNGMQGFTFTITDSGETWTSVTDKKDMSTSMSVQITNNLSSNTPGIGGYLKGTFEGTVTKVGTDEVQTVSGSFCAPWSDFSPFR